MDIVIFIISVIVLLFSVCFGFIVFGAAFKLMMEASDRLDRWIKRNADRLFTLDIDFFKKKK